MLAADVLQPAVLLRVLGLGAGLTELVEECGHRGSVGHEHPRLAAREQVAADAHGLLVDRHLHLECVLGEARIAVDEILVGP